MHRDVLEAPTRAASRQSVEIAALISSDFDQFCRNAHTVLYQDVRKVRAALDVTVASDPWNEALQAFHLGLSALLQAVVDHMEREDELLFPWLRTGRLAELRAPVRGLRMEHQSFEEELERLAGHLCAAEEGMLSQSTGPALVAAVYQFDVHLRSHMETEDRLVYARVLDRDLTEAGPFAAAPFSQSGRGSSDRWNASLK